VDDFDHKLVYSSHPEIFMKPQAAETMNPGNRLPPFRQELRLRREKAGRGGKTVTVVFDFQASDLQRQALAKDLQKFLGTGGTVKEGRVELQGDQMERLKLKLTEMGYRPKQAGG
jgi:translation initiation factor 1